MALAALVAWHPVRATAAAAAAANGPCWLRTPPVLPEPQPIQIDQVTADRAASILNAVAQGTFDRTQLIPELQTGNTPAFFARASGVVIALGPVQSMVPFEQRITANETSTYFRVRFPKETLTWVVSVNQQNNITSLSLRRTASCLIVNIVYRSAVPY
jgi:hypothetical protein